MSKKILFISRHAPYGSSIARDALDAILVASAYEQELSILFMDDGVFQLLQGQSSEHIGQKNIAALLPVFELYEIERIYVHKESLQERGINQNELVLNNAQIIDSITIHSLFTQQHQLLSF